MDNTNGNEALHGNKDNCISTKLVAAVNLESATWPACELKPVTQVRATAGCVGRRFRN